MKITVPVEADVTIVNHGNGTKTVSIEDKVELGTLQEGDKFEIKGIEFVILEKTKDGIKVITYDSIVPRMKFGETADYRKSKIRTYLEEDFYPDLAAIIGRQNIIKHRVSFTTVDCQDDYGEFLCEVRPPTFEEVRLYNKYITKNKGGYYFTCTPWSTIDRGYNCSVVIFSSNGSVQQYRGEKCETRPVCILKPSIKVIRKILVKED